MNHATELYEKRWRPRHHTIFPVHCQLSIKEESGIAWLRDFSNIGASLISNLPLTAGDEVTLTWPKKGHSEMTVVATVRWKQGQLIGVEFHHTSKELATSPLPEW